MSNRNSEFYTLKYVAAKLNEDKDLILEISAEMFPEDGCIYVYDKYPISELSVPITVFTPDGIDHIRQVLADGRDYYVEQLRQTRKLQRAVQRAKK